MNVFSNIGITELIIILLLALIVVGPERLPELGRKLGQALRDFRKLYDNLTSDLGPELMSLQRSTQELRESVQSVRSIPQDLVQSVVKASELEDTVKELQEVGSTVSQVGQTLSSAGQVIKDPVDAAVRTARSTLLPGESSKQEAMKEKPKPEEPGAAVGAAAGPEQPAAADRMPAGQQEEKAVDAVQGEEPAAPDRAPAGQEGQQADGSSTAEHDHD